MLADFAIFARADGGKGEAVAGYVIPQRLNSDDPVISLYRKPEGGARFPLYTAPQAECAPREAVCDRIVCWHNRRCVNDDAATMRNCPHRAAPQAECAPREAQPVDLLVCSETIRTAILRGNAHAAGLAAGLASLAKEKGFPNYAAPTPERADAGKDAALTDREIIDISNRVYDTTKENYTVEFARAILAADKESQP
jgi:hypothetical protein